MKKGVFIILDGLGDHPIKELGGKTPLEAAKKPNINRIVRDAENGIVYTVKPGYVPGSDTGHLSLFGYDIEKYYIGRGTYEALGAGINLNEGDISFRVNFATVNDNKIIDRRIGRNPEGLNELLNDFASELEKIEKEYGIKIILKSGVEHRGVLVIKGLESGINIEENDKHEEGIYLNKIKSLDKESKPLEEVLNKIIQSFNKFSENHEINKKRKEKNLPEINYILIRGTSKYREIKKEEKFENLYKLKGLFIANPPMYLGVAKYVGLDTLKPIGSNGTANENLFTFAQSAISNRNKYDIIFIHIKGTDSLSHDKKPSEKKKFIERIDEELLGEIKDYFDVIVITSDHSTSSILGRHISLPVPITIYHENARKGFVREFSERKAVKGTLGTLYGKDVIKIVLDAMDKYIMLGT